MKRLLLILPLLLSGAGSARADDYAFTVGPTTLPSGFSYTSSNYAYLSLRYNSGFGPCGYIQTIAGQPAVAASWATCYSTGTAITAQYTAWADDFAAMIAKPWTSSFGTDHTVQLAIWVGDNSSGEHLWDIYGGYFERSGDACSGYTYTFHGDLAASINATVDGQPDLLLHTSTGVDPEPKNPDDPLPSDPTFPDEDPTIPYPSPLPAPGPALPGVPL